MRALTSMTSQWPPRDVLIRLNQIMRGWANYFRHAVCKHTLDALENFAWHRVIRWQAKLHHWNWKDVRRRHTGPNGRWPRPHADGIELFNIAKVLVTRHLYRGSKIPSPWTIPEPRLTAGTVESPLRGDVHGGFGERPGETDREQPGTAPQADSTKDPDGRVPASFPRGGCSQATARRNPRNTVIARLSTAG